MPSSSFGVGKNGGRGPSAPPQLVEPQLSLPADELQHKRVSEILATLQSGRAYSLHGLADEFNLSKSYLQRLFKQQTGLRLGHIIIEQKLDRAAQLLKSTNMRIKEIAASVGYEHTSSFIRAFERRFSDAPQVYRRRCNHRKC
jgi:AraC-like DNA-binding protein